MADMRTSIFIDKKIADRIKKSADADRRGWTVQLVFLAEEALDRREADRKSPRQPMRADGE